jgi:competence protein ComEC
MWTFDVGQGQAVLVRERGAAVLLDTADDRDWSGTRRVVSRLHELGVRDADLLLVSHADRDHAGGLHEMGAALAPRAILLPDAALDAPELLASIAAASRRGIPVRPVRAGDTVTVGPLRLDVRSPERGWLSGDNEASLVVRVQTSGFNAWIPGDAGLAVETRLLASRSVVRSDILVAGHHGSRDATGSDFLAALAPRAVIVSSGRRNRFGHPHPNFVSRVNDEGIRLFITANGGDVRVGMWRGRLVVTQPGNFAPD